jgi:hypothetical protein
MWQGWITGLLGVWLVISTFFGLDRAFYAWNDFIVGLIIGILGLTMAKATAWQGWLAVALGVWLIIASFIPGLQEGTGLYVNNIISGVVGMIAGFSVVQAPAGHGRPAGAGIHMPHPKT